MRSRWLSSTAAVVVTGLLALSPPAAAQGKAPAKAAPAKPAPAGKAPAKPAPAKPAPAKPAAGGKAPAKPTAAKPMTEKQKKEAARKSYKDAEAKFKDGKYNDALTLYKEADELLPIPATKYKIAVCRDKLGQVIESAAAYQIFLDSQPPADKMADAISDAKSRLDAIKKTPGKVRVALEPASAPKPMISVDGGPAQPAILADVLPSAPAGQIAPPPVKAATLTMAPGHHKITAMADGYEVASTELDLSFAETRDVKIALNVAAPTAPPPTVAQNEPPPPPAPPAPPPRSNVPAYVTLGLAGAGLVVGGIFGGLALKSKGDFNDKPTTENADKTDRNALISDMSFAVALTFGVTGAVLLLSNDSPAQEAQKAALHPTKKKSAVRGFVTPYFSPQGGGAAAFVQF